MNSIRQYGADDVLTTIRYTATCRYCGRLIECLNADQLLSGKEVPDREHPEALERRMEWAHRAGLGKYHLQCKPEEYTGEYEGYEVGSQAIPRVSSNGRYSAYWTILVSVNGVDRFGVRTTGRDSAKQLLPKVLIWNRAEDTARGLEE